jgi:LemA protein
VVVLLVLVWGIATYNRFVGLRAHIRESWSDIDVELERRYELIPNLVETVKGYAAHEQQTLQRVVELRAAAVASTGSPESQGVDETALQLQLGRLFALAEAYPDLKANQNMMQLSEELTSTENRVAFARQAYNDAVMAYNNKREVFPASLIAGMGGFKPAALFEVDDPGKREAPKVTF